MTRKKDTLASSSSALSLSLVEGQIANVAGREIRVQFLNVNDMILLQGRVGGSLDNLDMSDFSHLRLFYWLILRKSDPNLTTEQIETETYPLTEVEMGRRLTLKFVRHPENIAYLDFILKGSGIIPDPADEQEVNGNSTTGAKPSTL